jgi:hypothetical protein
VARKIYKNVYLFELNISPLQIQKHNRELEIIVQEGILNTLRESIPVDAILKAYMDETIEENVTEEIKEQYVDEPIKVDTTSNTNNTTVIAPLLNNNLDNVDNNVDNNVNSNLNNQKPKLSFSNNDFVRDEFNNEQVVNASKDIDRLEKIGIERARQRKLDEADDDDDDNVRLKISDQNVDLDSLDIHQISEPNMNLLPDLLIDDIEILT